MRMSVAGGEGVCVGGDMSRKWGGTTGYRL